jgi:hypothetical protein
MRDWIAVHIAAHVEPGANNHGSNSVAVTGCGVFAQDHVRFWKDIALENVDLITACDADPDQAKATATSFSAASFTKTLSGRSAPAGPGRCSA